MANISYGVNILPKTNNAYTLGNSDYKWSNIFTNQINGTDVASIIAGGGNSGEGSSVDVSDKVDKAALLDAGITASTYTVAFGGAFTVTTATDSNHTIPYAKAAPTGTIDKYKRFRVTINDTEYVMESGIWFISNKYYNYLGNLTKIYDHAAWIPGGIIDVPFLITFDRDSNSSIEVWTTTAGTYTIKIEAITDTFKKLPSELIYGSAYPPILQCKNEGSTFSGYSLGVNILRNRRGTMAFGYGNELLEDFALALGSAHSINGEDATAVGFNNSVNSDLAISLGEYNIMYGSSPYSTIVGAGNTINSSSSQSGTFGQRNTIEPYSQYAHALGYWNICDGENAYALGYSNCAFSDQTMAIGNGTTASVKDQIVLGTLNISETADAWVASTSYAVGDIVYKNNRLYKCITANSDSSFTSSKWERCRGQFLEILGNGDIETLNRSNARATDWNGNTYIKGNLYVGCNADSSGGILVPTSSNAVFTGSFSHNRKASTTVGTNSIALGENCEASGEDSCAIGRYTTANGYYSYAEGNYTTASGMASHAQGTVTVASHASQNVFGEYNVVDSSNANAYSRGNYVEIVGNGTASNALSNARTLDWNGNERLKGDLYVGCNADSSGGTKVATLSNISNYNNTPWELIREETFTNSEEADHLINVDGDGNSFSLTDILFMFETPKSTTTAAAKGTYGQVHFYYDNSNYMASESGAWTQAADTAAHGFMVKITQEPGGLVQCDATAQATNSNSAAWRSRYSNGFNNSSQNIRFFGTTKTFSKINIKTVTGTGHYLLYGKRAAT